MGKGEAGRTTHGFSSVICDSADSEFVVMIITMQNRAYFDITRKFFNIADDFVEEVHI